MDGLIYTLMSGAERSMRAQRVHANNLANIETNGFRADMDVAVSQSVGNVGYDARHIALLKGTAVSSREGALRQTERELDVAIQGAGYLTVQTPQGEGYTRAGSLSVAADGSLSINGRPVLGDGGPIVLPPHAGVSITSDGTISIVPPGTAALQQVDKLKLVNPEPGTVTKDVAGLVIARNGQPLAADPAVSVRSRHLESSNVSAVEEMVATMNLNRDFEIQMKLYKTADSMAEAGNRLVRE